MNPRLLVTTAIALILRAGTTLAADPASLKGPLAPPPAPPPLWTGFYAGLNAGYSWDASPNVLVSGFPIQTGLDDFWSGTYAPASAFGVSGLSGAHSGGAIGGAQLGYNYQFGRYVIGAEVDIQGVGARGRGGFFNGAGASIIGFSTDSSLSAVEIEKSVDWLGTVRGRVGYLITPHLLGYATGGLAYGGVTASALIHQQWSGAVGASLQSSGADGRTSATLVGWTIGGGAEWAFAPDLSLKAEYLYYDLGSAHLTSSPLTTSLFAGLSNTVLVSSRARFDGHLARLGLNYHFNPLGAPSSPNAVLPPPRWTGLYAGLNAGYSWDASPHLFASAFPGQSEIDALSAGTYTGLSHGLASALASTGAVEASANGFIAGGQIGYQYRFERFVAGLETDIQGSGIRGRGGFSGSASATVVGAADSVLSSLHSEKIVDWLGTTRGRLGYLITPTLLSYATGGLAYGGVTARAATFSTWTGNMLGPLLVSSNSVGSFSDTLIGWTVGGGVEWAFAPNFSVKAEYLHYDLGDGRFASSPLQTTLIGFFTNSVLPVSQTRFAGHIARAGVNYHFDFLQPPAAIVAKY